MWADCNQELTLPILTGQGAFIMVSTLLSAQFTNTVVQSLGAERGDTTSPRIMTSDAVGSVYRLRHAQILGVISSQGKNGNGLAMKILRQARMNRTRITGRG